MSRHLHWPAAAGVLTKPALALPVVAGVIQEAVRGNADRHTRNATLVRITALALPDVSPGGQVGMRWNFDGDALVPQSFEATPALPAGAIEVVGRIGIRG